MSVGVFLSKSLSPRGGGDFVCSLDPQITLFSAYLIGARRLALSFIEGRGDPLGNFVKRKENVHNYKRAKN